MDNDMKKFNELYEKHNDFLSLVSEIIDYNGVDSNVTGDYLNAKWNITDETLTIIYGNDEYGFTISSFGSKSEKFYKGEVGDFILVMAYQDNWDETEVYILKKENKVNKW